MSNSSNWIVNRETSHLNRKIRRVKQGIGININVKRHLRSGARRFTDFGSDDVSKSMEVCFQLFIKTCEIARDNLWAVTKQRSLEVNKSPLSFYIEHVRGTGTKEITDYTFWAFVHDYGSEVKSLDFNKIFADLINDEVSVGHKRADRNANRGNKKSYIDPDDSKPHHRWKLSKDPSALPAYFDMLTNLTLATQNSDNLRTMSLDAERSLLSAVNLFSVFAAIAGRGTPNLCQADVHPSQRVDNYREYIHFAADRGFDIEDDDNDDDDDDDDDVLGTGTARESTSDWNEFHWPDHRYATKIHVQDMTVENIINKFLPHFQDKQQLGALNKIPLMIAQFEQHHNGGKKAGLTYETISRDVREFIREAQRPQGPTVLADDEDDENEDTPVDIQVKFRRRLAEFATYMGLGNILGSSESELNFDHTEQFNANFLRSCSGFIMRKASEDGTPAVGSFISDYMEVRAEVQELEKAIDALREKILSSTALKNPRVVLRKLYILKQRYALQRYIDSCRSKDADVSVHERNCILAFTERGYYEPGKYYFAKVAENMSPFVSGEILEYINNSTIYFTAHLHSELSLYTKYARDAYRMQHRDIHLNAIMISPDGSRGKSWVLTRVQRRMAPDTTVDVAHQSSQSGIDDERNQNGAVNIAEEMDATRVGAKDPRDTNRSNLFRATLTNGERSADTLEYTANGKRVTRHYKVDCISVWLGAANWNKDLVMDSAVQSRFHMRNLESTAGGVEPGNSILEMEMQGQLLDRTESKIEQHMNYRYTQKQLLFFELEHLIHIGAFTDVSTHMIAILAVMAEKAFANKGLEWPNFRDPRRTIILARNNAISGVLDRLFFTEGAKYKGRRIEPEMLQEIDNALYVNSEHAVAAFGEHIDLYYDRFETIVHAGLIAWFKSGNQNDWKTRIARRVGVVLEDGKSKMFEFDWNFVFMQHNQRTGLTNPRHVFHVVAAQLKNFTDRLPNVDYHPGVAAIGAVLYKWSTQIVNSKSYKHMEDVSGVAVRIDRETETRDMPKIKIDGANVLMHRSIFENAEDIASARDVLIDMFKATFGTQYQSPHTFAFDNDPKTPYIRNVIHTRPGPSAKPLVISMGTSINPTCKDILGDIGADMSDNLMTRDLIIEQDLDEWAQLLRSEAVGITEEPISRDFLGIDVFDLKFDEDELEASDYDDDDDVDDEEEEDELAVHAREMDNLFASGGSDDDDESATTTTTTSRARNPRRRVNDVLGHFVGTPIRKTFNLENRVMSAVQVLGTYRKLDLTDSDIQASKDFDAGFGEKYEDYDFDPAEYVVDTVNDQPVYHWEYLTTTLQKYYIEQMNASRKKKKTKASEPLPVITKEDYKTRLRFTPWVENDLLNLTVYKGRKWRPYDPQALKYKVNAAYETMLKSITKGNLLESASIKNSEGLQSMKFYNRRLTPEGNWVIKNRPTIGQVALARGTYHQEKRSHSEHVAATPSEKPPTSGRSKRQRSNALVRSLLNSEEEVAVAANEGIIDYGSDGSTMVHPQRLLAARNPQPDVYNRHLAHQLESSQKVIIDESTYDGNIFSHVEADEANDSVTDRESDAEASQDSAAEEATAIDLDASDDDDDEEEEEEDDDEEENEDDDAFLASQRDESDVDDDVEDDDDEDVEDEEDGGYSSMDVE